jgi:hypothetical protein
MSKPHSRPHPLPKPAPPPPSSEETDLRLQRQLQLNQQAQLELSQTQTQLSYCAHFLKVVREQHQEMKSSYLLARTNHFAGWENRIKQFTVAAIHHKTPPNDQTAPKQAASTPKKGSCSQGKHLREVLDRTAIEREEEEISQLEQKLNLLYDKISSTLHEELLSDKILGRIKREARRAAKSKLFSVVDREMGKYRSWQRENSSQLDSEMEGKQVEEKIMQNLEQMKLIMAKKVATNDYIYEQFGEEANAVHVLIDRIAKLPDSLAQNYQSTNALITQRYLQLQATSPHPKPTTPPKPLDLASVSAYFRHTQSIISHLEATPHPELQQQYQRINGLLERRISSLQPKR